jgi:hypothetical protein
VWQANRYDPPRTDPSTLPPGLQAPAPVYRVQAFNVDKRMLVAALSAGLDHLILRGEIADVNDILLRVHAGPFREIVSLEARAVVVAAGCGTKRRLRDVFDVDDVVLDRITYTKTHMICVRSPTGVLPDVGTVVSPELIIVGHPSADRSTSEGGLVAWYVTPANPTPLRYTEAPDDGAAEIDPPVVRSAIRSLVRLVPWLSNDDERVQATVFAGFKQEFDGQPTRRVCEVLDGERNLIMALPSVLANAVANAMEAVGLVRQQLEATTPTPELRWDAGVAVGRAQRGRRRDAVVDLA